MVVLQCCVSFYCTAEFPVLYSRFLLVIYFIHISVYMSIPVSQFIPPPHFSHLGVYTFVLYICIITFYSCTMHRCIDKGEEKSILVKNILTAQTPY